MAVKKRKAPAMSENGKSWVEYVHLSTPYIVIGLSLFVATIKTDIARVEKGQDEARLEIAHHLQNSGIHIPRETVVSKDEFCLYQTMRDRQMTDIKDELSEIKKLLNEHMKEGKK